MMIGADVFLTADVTAGDLAVSRESHRSSTLLYGSFRSRGFKRLIRYVSV